MRMRSLARPASTRSVFVSSDQPPVDELRGCAAVRASGTRSDGFERL